MKNEPAFPVKLNLESDLKNIYTKGLTKREYFAAMIIQSLAKDRCFWNDSDRAYQVERMSEQAIKTADALIKALESSDE